MSFSRLNDSYSPNSSGSYSSADSEEMEEMEAHVSPMKSTPTSSKDQQLINANYEDLSQWAGKEYLFQSDLSAICNKMDKHSITKPAQVQATAQKEEWCASPISPINWQDPWAQNQSDPWDVSTETIKPDPRPADDSPLSPEEFYERYPWDSPQFIFEADMSVLCSQMEDYRITRDVCKNAEERLQNYKYPHFNRPKKTLFKPMTTSYRLNHERPGQFEDVEEASANQRNIGQSFQGKIRNTPRGNSFRNQRTSPY